MMKKKLINLVAQNRFLFMVIGAIAIAIAWVIISVAFYINDGTHLLDLSRPGYEPVREQVRREDSTQSFRADGALDVETLEGFMKNYNEQIDSINQLDDFSGQALDDTQLKLEP